jgi:hypothetical protein
MRTLLTIIGLFAAATCRAENLPLGVQFGAPAGFSSAWTELGTGGCKSPGQCTTIPGGKVVRQCKGTQTLKTGQLELLARIVCGGKDGSTIVWVGHNVSSIATGSWVGPMPATTTVRVATPVLDPNETLLTGDGSKACWVEYQINNSGASTPAGGAWEMQAVCSAF